MRSKIYIHRKAKLSYNLKWKSMFFVEWREYSYVVTIIYDVLLCSFLEIIYVYSQPFTCFHNLVVLGYVFIIATNK